MRSARAALPLLIVVCDFDVWRRRLGGGSRRRGRRRHTLTKLTIKG